MKIFKKASGQGMVEYALILVLVAIIVIGALMILEPILGVATAVNKEALSMAPIIYDYGNPIYLPMGTQVNSYIKVDYEECQTIQSGKHYLKAGTTYQDPSVIKITHQDDGTYEICNDLRGTSIDVIFDLYDAPK